MKNLIRGAVLIVISVAMGGVFGSLGWIFIGMLLIVSLGFVALVAMVKNFGVAFGMLFIISGVGLITFSLQNYSLLSWKTAVITPREAATHTSATSFQLTDKKILMEYEAHAPIIRQVYKGGSYQEGSAYVAPLVSSDWKKGDQIPMWVMSKIPESSTGSAMRIVNLTYDDFLPAVTVAEKTFGLTSIPHAPILRWVEDPQAEYQAMLKRALGIAGGGILSLLVLAGGVFLVKKFKKAGGA